MPSNARRPTVAALAGFVRRSPPRSPRCRAAPSPPAPASGAASRARARPPPGSVDDAALRRALRCVVNEERARHGLRRLRRHADLGEAARDHARDMVERGYFAHERPGSTLRSRLRAAGWTGSAPRRRWRGAAAAWACRRRCSTAGWPARRTARSCSAATAAQASAWRSARRIRRTAPAPGCGCWSWRAGFACQVSRSFLAASRFPATLRCARFPGEPAHGEHDSRRRPEREHEQRRHVWLGEPLAGDHRARQPVDQVLERQRLGDRAQERRARRRRRRRRPR